MALLVDGFGKLTKAGKNRISEITAMLTLRGYKYLPETLTARSNHSVTLHIWQGNKCAIGIDRYTNNLYVRAHNSAAKANLIPLSFKWESVARALNSKAVLDAEGRT